MGSSGRCSCLVPCLVQLFFGLIIALAFGAMLGLEMEYLSRGEFRYDGEYYRRKFQIHLLEPPLTEKTPIRALSHLPSIIPAIVMVSVT